MTPGIIDTYQAERIPVLLLPPKPLLILSHLSKKRHQIFPVNVAKEDKCQRDGDLTAPAPSMPSDCHINTGGFSKGAGVFQKYNTMHQHGTVVIFFFYSNEKVFISEE